MAVDIKILLGRNVARLRQARGLTQEELAERAGFSQQYLSGLERGARNPTLGTIYEVARALGVSHLDLLADDDGSGSSTAWLRPS